MDQQDYTVKDINVSESTYFTPTGQTARQKKVTYFVGTHGPFTLVYDAAQGTAATIKTDIAAQVAELKSIDELRS